MKKQYLLFRLLALCLVIFSACSDDDDEQPDDRQLLTSKNWKISALTLTQGPTTVDFYSQLDPCDQDDVWKFSDNGSYEVNEGPTKCDPNSPQVYESGTWKLENGTLSTTESGSTTNYRVVEITANTLKLTADQVLSGTNTTFNFGFTGQ